jgi:hypothetical protein
MMNQFEDFQKMSKDNIDLAVKSFGVRDEQAQRLEAPNSGAPARARASPRSWLLQLQSWAERGSSEAREASLQAR